jgi:hypothetical protein
MAQKKTPIIAGIACRNVEGRENLLTLLRAIVAKKMKAIGSTKVTRYDVAMEALTALDTKLATDADAN